jgi:hypothetical protein
VSLFYLYPHPYPYLYFYLYLYYLFKVMILERWSKSKAALWDALILTLRY